MKVVFIAGPFRGRNTWEVEQNVRRAEELALKVAELGATPLCPHTNTRFFDGLLNDRFWLAAAQELLRRSDAVMLVEGWEGSTGTQGEIELAKQERIPVFASLYELQRYLQRFTLKNLKEKIQRKDSNV